MKRFYKFLLPLVAIVAMAMPWNARAQVTVEIGDGGTTTNSYLPMYTLYNNTLSEQIYTASEIGMAGTITSISFYNGGSEKSPLVKLYMINTTRTDFSSNTDWLPVTAGDLVFQGNVTFTANQWTTITLDNPFLYDGSSNLGLIFDGNLNWSSGLACRVFSSTSNCAMYVYSDGTDYDAVGATYSANSRLSEKNQIQLEILSGDISCYPVKNFTASNIGPQGCTLTWLDTSNSGASYAIYNMADTTLIDVTTDTFYVLTGLTSNTPYDFGVVTVCGYDDSSMMRRISFRTACSYIDAVPYTEDFESYGSGTGVLPSCWYKLGSTADRPYIYGTTSYGHNNSHCLYFYAASSGYCYGIMPPVDPMLDITTMQVRFWARQWSTSYNCSFAVGVMTDPTDASTFVAIDTVHPAGTAYEEFEVSLASYTDTGNYIAFKAIYNSGSSIYIALDDVTLEPIPTCLRPDALTATNVTPDSIYLSISDDLNSEWVLIYGLSGFNPDTAVDNVINITDTAASIGGLLANTSYDIYVAALCSGGDTSLSRMITVRTACSYITSSSLPYTEDFESYGSGTTAFPTCWYKLGSTADRPYINATTSYGHNNSHGLYFYATSSGGYCYAIMPPVAPDLDVNTLQVNFWARQYSTSYNCDFEVGVMTDPADLTTFTAVSRVHPAGTNYEEFEVPLSTYTDSGSYVAFRAVQHPGTSTYIYLMLDDVSLGLLPPCVSPSISVYNVGVHDATVSWDANSDYNEMSVFWGTGNDFANATDSTVVTGDNSYTITGLAANTNYHVWIRATCADGYSRVMGDTFTTLLSCYPVTGLNVTPGPVSAMATWTQSTSDWTDYTVEYKEASDTTWTSATTTNNYFPIVGLTPATEYNFRIIATCVEGTSVAATANFRTTNFGCLVADSANLVNDTIGNGTTTSSYFPTYSFYNYSLTQQIYLASDFSVVSGGQIEEIGIQMSAVPVARNIEIYMTNTSATNVSSAFIPIAASDLVWSGSTTGNIAAGWNNITLTTPFNYTGGNILVTFRDMTGSYSSGNAGMVTSSTSGISRYVYQDSDPYSVTNPPSGGTASSDRLNMYFKGGTCLTASTCAAPIVVANAVSTSAIELNWAPGASETSWQVYYRAVGDTVFTSAATASTTSYTVTGLNPGLDYEFKVVAVCGDNDMAGFATASTECAPVAVPYTEDFQNSDYGVYSRNCWTVGSTNIGTNYPIPYVISLTGDENNKLCLIYSGGYLIMPEMNAPLNTLQARFTLVQGGDNVRLIIGLMSDPTAPIQNIMVLDTLIRSDIDTSSATVTITFPFDMLPAGTTGHITFWDAFADNYNFIDNLVIEPIPACSPVTDVTVSNVTTTGATITWTAGGSVATGYIVEYGPRNFVPGNGTTVNATTNSIALTGLNHSSDYDVYVYTVCAGTSDTSMNSNRVRFTTPCDIPTLPYTENFDNCTDPGTTRSPLPNCWNYTMLSTGTYAGASYTPAVYYTSSTGYTSSGQYCLYLYGTALTVLPEMPTTVDSLYISFHHYTSSPSSYRLIIGAVDSITPGFDSSFVAIDTLVFSANENNVLRFLSTYTGTGRYIAFKNYYNNNNYDYSYHYIDDLEVGYMPSCVWPVDVHATGLTTTTAEFAWSICQASDYEYEYGPAGFTRGTGTTGTWSSTPYSIGGLTLGTQYDIYVRGICGAGDTSEWSSVYTFGTLNADPATVPFYCDFTDTTLANAGWEVVNGTQNNKWYVGNAESNGSPRALYISNDNGATNSYTVSGISITYAYRDVILTGGQYALSYDWKANGESTWDYIRAWLVPASQMPTAGYLPDGTTATSTFNSSGVAPAGWISIDGGAKLNQSTSWQTHEEELNVPAGTYHLLFMWANDASGGTNPPAAIDNVSLALNVCPISDITLANVTASTMQITWTGSSDGYELEYGPVGFSLGTGTTVNTTTNSATLTGLTSLTSYDIYLRAFCNLTDTSRWYRVRFVTEMCDNPGIVTSWDSTMNATTTSYSPIGYSCYNYSYIQMLIDSAQMASVGGDITAFSFLPSNSAAEYGSYFTNMEVYMANVSETSLTDFIHPDATHVFHHVISNGNFNFTSDDWQIISLDTAFTWDGHSSVLFAVNRGHGSYSCSASFSAHEGTGNKVVYDYDDDYPFNINTASGGDVSSTMGDLRLISCGGCPAPAVSMSGITYEEATINAVGSGVSYEMQYGTDINAMGNTLISTTGVFNLANLTPATQYFFQVRQNCGDNEMSGWSTGAFTTDSLPCMAVSNLTLVGTTFNSISVSWTANGEETAWEVHVFSTIDDTTVTVTTTAATVGGLVSERLYNISVRPMCGSNHNIEGPWSDTIQATTDQCQPVTNLTVSNIGATMATIGWTAPAGAEHFRVIYGLPNFDQGGELGTYNTESNPFVLTELEANSDYTVRVANVCAENLVSQWTSADFTTVNVGINGVEFDGSLSLYPNPASTTVTLSVSEQMVGSTVSIVDVNGRVVMSEVLNAQTLTMNLSDMAKGAYFVRITGEETTVVRKLIVE